MKQVLYHHRVVLLVVALGFLYALVRYVVLGPVAADQVPLYIVNKAISLAALLLLALALITGPRLRRAGASPDHPLHPRLLGTAGLLLAGLHAGMSWLLFNPDYFEKFYHANRMMTWQAETAMLTGFLATALLLWQAFWSRRGETGSQPNFPRSIGIQVVVLGALHVLLIGYEGWRDPGSWYGGLPPLTLIAFLFALVALGIRLLKRKT